MAQQPNTSPVKPSTTSTTVFDAAVLDTYAERITTGVALLGGVLMLPALFSFLSGIRLPAAVVTAAVAVALAAWLFLNYAVQPTSYTIEAGKLLIKRRLARRMVVPFKQIIGVSAAGAIADMPRFGLRRSFNIGVFGYEGPAELDPYGAVFFSATNRERLVAVARLDRTPLIISPARPRDFVDALREALMKQAGDREEGGRE
jgi:hypothetical protein